MWTRLPPRPSTTGAGIASLRTGADIQRPSGKGGGAGAPSSGPPSLPKSTGPLPAKKHLGGLGGAGAPADATATAAAPRPRDVGPAETPQRSPPAPPAAPPRTVSGPCRSFPSGSDRHLLTVSHPPAIGGRRATLAAARQGNRPCR